MEAVIRVGSSQHLVKPGSVLLVDRPQIDAVLLVIDDQTIHVGQPHLTQAEVSFTNLGIVKGKKIRVSTYKAKSRYRKTRGFRPRYTQIKIADISVKNSI